MMKIGTRSLTPKRTILLGGALGICPLLVVLLLAYRQTGNEPARVTIPSKPSPAPTGIVKFLMEQQWRVGLRTAVAEERELAGQVTAIGKVVPTAHGHAAVVAPVSGRIVPGDYRIPGAGKYVRKGQVLAILEQTPTAAEAAQVYAQEAQLNAERLRLDGLVTEAKTNWDLAKIERDRAKRLYEQKAFSLRQLQQAEAEVEVARANHEAAVMQHDTLDRVRPRIGLDGANKQVTVSAPISGTILKVNVTTGEQVDPTKTLYEIIALSTVWVEAPIFEKDLPRLREAQEASFTTDAYPDVTFSGRILHISDVIDEQTRAAEVVFEVPNPKGLLRIGMKANVRIETSERRKMVVIPVSAVLDHEGQKIVYTLVTGEEFARRVVTVGETYGDIVAVLDGIKPGERVVTQGSYQLKLQELRPGEVAHTHET